MSYRPSDCRGPSLKVGTALLVVLLCAAGVRAETAKVHSPTVESVRLLIEESIRLGVPLYNSGQQEACAAVYRTALRSLQLLAGVSVDGPRLERVLRTAEGQEPDRSAWTLRYALDDIYETIREGNSLAKGDFELDFPAGRGGAWYAVNDNVMGGVSQGGFAQGDAGTGLFAGRLSMRNNGGFSSVRTRVEGAALAGYDGIEMRVRGDGRTYALLASDEGARGSWQRAFTAPEQWQTVRVPFDEMALSIRGWRPNTYPPISGRRVQTLGFIISDKDERPFRLEVDWMRGYSEETRAVEQ